MAEGVLTQTVPIPSGQFDAEDEAQFRRQVESFMQNTQGRISRLTGGSVVEAWDGSAITVSDADITEQTTVHTLSAAGSNGLYLVHLVFAYDNDGAGSRGPTWHIEYDPDGSSGWTTENSFIWIYDPTSPSAEQMEMPLVAYVHDTTIVSGAKFRLRMTGDLASGTWTTTLTPEWLVGQ